ncbi:hypothetical protein DM01DRAFT_1323275 [Hesseltinella vesiculosa]|uniref:Tetratricopeptide repeat protein 39B n=1 Tax=Hesseltinella vesiculosa TaxID=101127 RepID=A0A1X2GFZ1_9FUNG|nr:hypothetical protein DM01DRAFT_1323275 [Hesseltinella vesiculosa]
MAKPGMIPQGRNAKSMGNLYTGTPSLRSVTRLGSLSELPVGSFANMTIAKKHEKENASLYKDIAEVRKAMDYFLNSRVAECEAIILPQRRTSMYHALGYAFVLSLQSLMTFQRTDVEDALGAMKEAYQIADKYRKRDNSWKNVNMLRSYSIQDYKNMTPLQRHAELVFAETYLMKAGLQIVYDESFVSFLKEALKVPTSYNIYKSMEKYMLHVQAEAALGKDVSEYGLDEHLASGIAFGTGCFNLVVSMLPDIVLKLAQMVGFSGDRDKAMNYYRSVGGWDDPAHLDSDGLPELQGPEEGLRRTFCDMMLLLYNIVLSKLIPLSHVDSDLADRILTYSLRLYPDGIFFLYFSGRQLASKRQLEEAKTQFMRGIEMQKDWKQLQHVCYWELGLMALLQQDWRRAHEIFQLLNKESNWSKCVYTYVQATSLYMFCSELPPGPKRNQLLGKVNEMMKLVTKARRKIAGKSIFVEKFAARKSRKFELQGHRLLFPDLEVLLAFSALELMPVDMMHKNVSRIDATLKRLESNTSFYVHDDICLAHLLRCILLRMLIEDLIKKPLTADTQAQLRSWKQAHKVSVQTVMVHAKDVQLDHYCYYFTVYEDASMMILDGAYEQAKEKIKYLIRCSEKNEFGVGQSSRAKNKYSMENALIMKAHNGLEMVKEILSGKKKPVSTIGSIASMPPTLPTTEKNDDSDDDFQDAL